MSTTSKSTTATAARKSTTTSATARIGRTARSATVGASVVAISVDSPFAQEAWAKANAIKVTLLSDLNKTVIKAYDVVFPMLAGVGDTAARAAFVVGKDGVIKYAEQTATPKDLPNFSAIKAALTK